MFKAILFFNIKYLSRQYSFYAALAIALVLGVFGSTANYGSYDVFVNSPFAVSYFLGYVSFLMIFVVTIFCANMALRDTDNEMEEIVYTTPLTKIQYLGGEFFALAMGSFIVFAVIPLGFFAGTFFAPVSRVGPAHLGSFVRPLIIFGIPNVLLGTALLFASAKLTKNKTVVFITGIGIYILYMIVSIIGNSPLMASSEGTAAAGNLLPALVDPFGLVAYLDQTQYWTVQQRNTIQILPEGNFLINRLFWFLFSIVIFFVTYKSFSFRTVSRKSSSKKDASQINKSKTDSRKESVPVKIKVSAWCSFISKISIEIKSHIKSIPFLIIMILWTAFLAIELKESIFHGMFNSSYYPATGLIITLIIDPLSKIGIVIVLFFSAEIMHHERSVKFHHLADTYPVKNNVVIVSKAVVLISLLLILTAISIVTGIIFQAFNGYYTFEPAVYLSLFYYGTLPLILISALALFMQTLIPNKYLGMFITAAIILITLNKAALGPEHPLLRFAATPQLVFSDMNGMGHYQDSFGLLMVYWSAFAGLLIMFSSKLWTRGTEFKDRLTLKNITGHWEKTEKIALITFLLIIATTGLYIFNLVNIKNDYQTETDKLAFRAEYEKQYSRFASSPQPVIKDVDLIVDLYPAGRMYKVQGTYTVKNESHKSIDTLLVHVHPEVNSSAIILKEAKRIEKDDKYNDYICSLERPMLPGSEMEMGFTVTVEKSGFDALNSENSIVENGSYIELEKFVPHFGYASELELADPVLRETYGLPKQQDHAQLTTSKPDYQWINWSATFSTASGQRVVSVGHLKKEWTAGKRNYFRYVSQKPIPFMFACASADYEIQTKKYHGIDVEVYYQKGHDRNLPTMFKSASAALDIYSSEFSPYRYDHLRIVEIPHYPGAATSYPGTVFFKEKIGFQYDTRDTTRMNLAFLTIAHEISHQWWPGQMQPADTAGYKVLTESLAQYAEILVYERTFGKRFHRKYFKDAEDLYLTSRAYANEEPPLFIAEGDENIHIYYQKGLMVMYAIKELIGEDAFNQALVTLLNEYSYPRRRAKTKDFIEILYQITPLQKHVLIQELMKSVVLYDLKVEQASFRKTADGTYEVRAQIKIEKQRETKSKSEAITQINQTFDIGVFSDHPDDGNFEERKIRIKKIHFDQNMKNIKLMVEEKPAYVCIDPYRYIIDKNRMNNLFELSGRRN